MLRFSTRLTRPRASLSKAVVRLSSTGSADDERLYHMGVQSWHRLLTAGTFAQAATAAVLGPLVIVMPSELIASWQAYSVAGLMMGVSSLALVGWQALLRRLVLQVNVTRDQKTVHLTQYTPFGQLRQSSVAVEALTMDVLQTKLVLNTIFYAFKERGTSRAFILPKDPAFCDDYPRLERVLNGNKPFVPPQ